MWLRNLERYMRHLPTPTPSPSPSPSPSGMLARSVYVPLHSRNLRRKAADTALYAKERGESDQVAADWTQGEQA